MEQEQAVIALSEHVHDFIQQELSNRLDSYLAKLVSSGELDLSNWDGNNLELPRMVTSAILEEASNKVVWFSHRAKRQSQIDRFKELLRKPE